MRLRLIFNYLARVVLSMDFFFFLILFLKGILIGFVIAAPIGPIGVLCIRRTLSNHKVLASLTGLGAACADAFYSAIAAFSLAGISDLIVKYKFYLSLFGGILLLLIGFSILKNPSYKASDKLDGRDSLLHAFTSAFLLTVSNPITLIVFAAAFTAMGISPIYQSFFQASLLVAGVFIGASCWWVSLITAIYFMKHKLSATQLLWINRFSGVILIGFAVYILLSLI